jgi:Na+-transporting NADH:ubiquinone oxidoreductase subunit D
MVKGKLRKTFTDPLGKNNPVFAQILGICSTLAVTNKLENTVVMTIGVIFTTTLSSFTISLLRKLIPSRVRMMAETLIIASFVIVVDIFLKAYMPDIWRQLGPYVGLIITNCIIMGRAEAFALNNSPGLSLIDGLSSGIGYAYVLIIVAFFRELLGTGTLWGFQILGSWWTNWSIMIMPPGAFFMLAVFVWVVKGVIIPEEEDKK